MVIDLATRAIRRIVTGKEQKFVFNEIEKIAIGPLGKIDLYLHIPFCQSLCPYCPYNRIKYDKCLVGPYTRAVLEEIEQYYLELGNVEVGSIYIGGGTPTLLVDELGVIIESIRNKFRVTGDICIETSPSSLNEDIVRKLKSFGTGMISLGIQSFNNECLKALGRNYDSAMAHSALDLVLSSNFKSVNIDLMFTLPGQSLENVLEDLKEAVNTGIAQITIYPLFTFPYSTIGQYLKIKRLRMPNIIKRRRMYKGIHDFLVDNGYQQVSVWGFKKGISPRYSSVTRDTYIGLGAGAGSRLPDIFYFNTFSVKEYTETAISGRSPVAIAMELTSKFRNYYWLYWRFYDTCIDKKLLGEKLGKDIKLKFFFGAARIFGLLKENNEEIRLTERGAFYIHLMQNYFVLNYIDKVWSVAMKTPWPDRIKL